jgi:hypothetical protein
MISDQPDNTDDIFDDYKQLARRSRNPARETGSGPQAPFNFGVTSV